MIFEKPSKKALIVIKLQALALLMLLSTLLTIFFPIQAIIAVDAILSVLFLFLLFGEAKKMFAQDFRAYAILFFFLFVLIQASFATQFIPPTEMQLRLGVFFALAFFFLVFLIVFQVFFARNFVFGTVLSSQKDSALVETEFDLLSMVKAGKYSVETRKKFSKGEKVKLKIKQGFWGKKPIEIMQ